jgi:PAS domain-containing protein
MVTTRDDSGAQAGVDGDRTRGEPGTPGSSDVSAHLLERMLEAFDAVEKVELDAGGRIVDANAAFCRHIDVPLAGLTGRSVTDFLSAGDVDMVLGWAAGGDAPQSPHLVNFATRSDDTYTLRCIVARRDERLLVIGEPADAITDGTTQELMRVNNEFATLTRELARKSRELERTHAELSSTLKDLETSYWHLRKIQEVMPVCMGCGQVKADGSRWESVSDYLRSNEIFLSHGYCPPCAKAVALEYGLEEE